MADTPIPVRIPALEWRTPAILWIPIAMTLAVGWPALLFQSDPGLSRLALTSGACVFTLAMTSLALRWVVRGAPKARRVIVRHIVVAGAIVSVLAPFVLTTAMAAAANFFNAGDSESLSFSAALSMAPLALVLGLPASLVSGVVFALVALKQPPPLDTRAFPSGAVRPFP